MILKELNKIDWHSLNAEQVPVWMIGLTSADSSIRFQSWGELARYFCLHDAGLSVFSGYKQLLSSDAPVVATPFLIALLPSSHVEVKRTLLDILFEIANYRHRPYSDEVQQERANKLYDYLLQQFDVFLPFLDTDDSWVKEAAISLISAFEEKDAFVVDLLLRRIDTDWRYQRMDASEKTTVASAIGRKIHAKSILYQQFSQRFEVILQRWIENSWYEDISVQAVAAYYLIKLRGTQVEHSIVKMLANVLKVPSYNALDILLLEDCIDTFMELSDEIGTAMVLDIFDDQTTPSIILDLATALLGIHFGSENYRDVYEIRNYMGRDEDAPRINSAIHPAKPPFSKLQKTILEHFVAKDALWKIKTNLFKVFALPNTKDGLLSLIASNSSEVE